MPEANRPPSSYKPSEDEDNLNERVDQVPLDLSRTEKRSQAFNFDSSLTKTMIAKAEPAFNEMG